MKLARRSFLRGLVAVAVATTIDPTPWLSPELRKDFTGSAIAYLSRRYHEEMKRTKRFARAIYVGEDLWFAVEGEMAAHMRFIMAANDPGFKTLAFRATRLVREGAGWGVHRFEYDPPVRRS